MNDEAVDRLEVHLGRLLLVGVICAATLLLVGLYSLLQISIQP